MQSLTFYNFDFRYIDFPHKDALVVTLWMDEYEISRVLVDSKSGITVLFLFAIQHLGISLKGLMP